MTEAKAATRIAAICTRLETALAPAVLEVTDEGHLHVGHEGARDGRGHFHVRIVSDKFQGLGQIARHRLVYEALGDLMTTDIHALRISAASPTSS